MFCLVAKRGLVKTLRVGFFAEVYRPVTNGVVVAVDTLAQALRANGNDVTIVAPQMSGAIEEAHVIRIPSMPLPTRTPYRLAMPIPLPGALAAAADTFDLVHAHSPFVMGWTAAHIAKRRHLPLVYTYHTQFEEYAHYVPFEPNATRMATTRIVRHFADLADVVIAPTRAMADRLHDSGVSARIEVVPSGIDVRAFRDGRRSDALRARLGAAAGEPLTLLVSRLAKEKNVDLLLDAFARLRHSPLRLAIVGDGPQRPALEEHVRRLKLDRVRFMGAIARDELADVYASADVFAFPSMTETQGLVLGEASAAGLPVVAVDTPQNREGLSESGIFVPADAGAFAAALERAAGSPRAERAASAAAAERLSLETQVRRTLDLYRSLLGEAVAP